MSIRDYGITCLGGGKVIFDVQAGHAADAGVDAPFYPPLVQTCLHFAILDNSC